MSAMVQHLHREMVEACIEQLIALLDLLDGDPDLEDTGDLESSIGSTPQIVGTQCLDDLELDDCDLEEGGDDEGTMGWSNPMGLRVHIREEAEHIPGFDNEEDGTCRFDGSGNRVARMMLRHVLARPIKA
ncbi:hypothetical protein [Rhizobium bangladeshense]|uniref:hypothetical protein n=1 Tax=Rhizobium bangladeshense TaxID=1138189 RepID=UPI001C8293C3|nr:hypothetical protein [Rhizobium bangladeshense]MBX4899311.1 hypothetical protein [Rhizobium bangladeshense]